MVERYAAWLKADRLYVPGLGGADGEKSWKLAARLPRGRGLPSVATRSSSPGQVRVRTPTNHLTGNRT